MCLAYSRLGFSFLMRTAKECNALPASVFPDQYNCDVFKTRVTMLFLARHAPSSTASSSTTSGEIAEKIKINLGNHLSVLKKCSRCCDMFSNSSFIFHGWLGKYLPTYIYLLRVCERCPRARSPRAQLWTNREVIMSSSINQQMTPPRRRDVFVTCCSDLL